MAAKKLTKEQREKCRVLTPKFRVSYPHLFKAQAVNKDDKPKFSITMLFSKETEMKPIKRAIRRASLYYYGPDESDWPSKLINPIADGDDERFKDNDGYADHWVLKASTNEDQRPGVFDEKVREIIDPSKFYAGCFAVASIFAYRWEYMKREGISFILDSVQKVEDGKAFGGRKPGKEVFSPVAGAADDEDDDDIDEDEEDDNDDF